VLGILVSEIGLQRPRVVAVICELEAASVPQCSNGVERLRVGRGMGKRRANVPPAAMPRLAPRFLAGTETPRPVM